MKAHLTSSDEPLKEGETYVALCRKTIKNVRWVLMFDNSMLVNFRETLSSVMVCSKCLTLDPQGRYVWGMVEGSEGREDAR